jgi:hypothetical protein
MAMVMLASSAAAAAKPPTAWQLVQKLIKDKFCTRLQLVDATEITVTCTPFTEQVPIRVTAMKTNSKMLASLDENRRGACNVLEGIGLPLSDQTVPYVVGKTWYVAADPTHVSMDGIARELKGKVKTYSCV